ncbi:MAG: hypothetical protein HFI91_04100 [Lachnospiraceae bacterium]|jgi:hypothetical protein|nr:hypothetical protein [Lachnospiraceae bacterium]
MGEQGEIILQITEKLTEISGSAPCKKKVQKMIYLIEEKGIDIGFPYKIYIYGPYSADLDYKICELKAEGCLDIQQSNRGHMLKCITQPGSSLISDRMNEIISIFGKKNARTLELIATTLYAERYVEHKNRENIIKAVKKIKGEKFPEEKITDAICLLEESNYFSLAY